MVFVILVLGSVRVAFRSINSCIYLVILGGGNDNLFSANNNPSYSFVKFKDMMSFIMVLFFPAKSYGSESYCEKETKNYKSRSLQLDSCLIKSLLLPVVASSLCNYLY